MSASIGVELVYAEAGRAWRHALLVPAGSVVGDAVARVSSLSPQWPAAAQRPAAIAVFGREVDAATPLRDGDRVELLRALPTDPKLARRVRAGSRTAR